jgi:hypothetical protein
MGTQYESGGPFGGVGVNGTRFAEWGTPPGWDKAKGVSGGLENVDIQKSLSNMQRSGVVGQWTKMAAGGVVDEPIAGIGMDTGARYLMGEVGKEVVIPENMLQYLYLYMIRALTTGQIDNEYLRMFPADLQAAIRRNMTRYFQSIGRAAGPGQPIPGVNPVNGKPYTPAEPDPATLPGGPGKPIPGVNPINGKPYGDTPSTPFPEPVHPDPNWPGLRVGDKSGKVYSLDGKVVKFYTARYWIADDGSVYDGYTGQKVQDGKWTPMGPDNVPNKPGGWQPLGPDAFPKKPGMPATPPGVDSAIPPAPGGGATGAGTGGGDGNVIKSRLEISGEFYMVLPDGRRIVAAVIDDSPAMDVLAGETAKVIARNIQDQAPAGSGGGFTDSTPGTRRYT